MLFVSESFFSKRSICKLFMRCSQSNVSVSIDLQQVVVFGKDKDGKSARRSVGKMNFDANVAVFYQLKTDFTRIHLGCEIKSKQRTTIFVLFSRNIVACVAIVLTGLRKQTKVTSNIAVVGKVRLQGFGRHLNTVTIKRHEIDTVVLEMKRIFGDYPIVGVVIHHTDHVRVGNCPKNKFSLVMLRFPVGTVKLLTFTCGSGYFVVLCCKALT